MPENAEFPAMEMPTEPDHVLAPEAERSGRAAHGQLWGLFLLTLVSVAALIGLVYFAAQRQNETALDNTRHVMASVLGALESELSHLVVEYAWWDATYASLFPTPDEKWVEDNIGLYAAEAYDLSWTVVVDEADNVIVATDRGELMDVDFMAITQGGFADLVARTRAGLMEEPEVASGFVVIDGELNIVSVGAITPESPTEKQLERHVRPVLAYAKRVDKGLLDRIASDFRFDELRLTPPGETGIAAALPLYLADGTYFGNIMSRPTLPGQVFISDTMPWLGLFAIVLISISYVFMRRTRLAFTENIKRQNQLHKTNLALKFSEGRVRDFAESASDWFWEADSALRIRFVSDRITEITGLSSDEIVGRHLLDFFADSGIEDEDGQPEDIAELFKKQCSIRQLRVLWSRSGKRLYLSISATPVYDANDAFAGYRGTGTDVTARVMAANALRRHRDDLEQRVTDRTAELQSVNDALLKEIDVREQVEVELRQSENRYRQLVEHSPDAIAVFQDGRCVFANSAALKLFGGVSMNLVASQKIGDLLPPLSDKDRDLLELLTKTASFTPRSVSFYGTDDRIREADAMSAEIAFSGSPAILFILRDVTESKVAQRQLAQAAKLATLGEMAAGMAHELRQPLNIIRMASDASAMMLEEGDADIEHFAQEFSAISTQCERMAEIIDHMQVFGRGDSGEAVSFSPSETVRYATAMLERQFRLDDIRIKLDAAERVRSIIGFPVRLEQVMVNLLNNAREAILDDAEAGPVSDTEDRMVTVTVRDDPGDDHIEIAVEDAGGGIDQGIIGRIFDPFFTTKAVGEGTGLGLSIVYGIVTEMGGTIEADNTGKGTRFTINLPVGVTETAPMESTNLAS